MKRRVPPILLLFLLLLLPACAGKKFEAAYDAQRQALKQAQLTRPKRSVAEGNAAPYQLAFRLSPRFLEKSMGAMFADNLLESEQVKAQRAKKASQPAAPSDAQATAPQRPSGPFGGRLLERLTGAPGGGVAGTGDSAGKLDDLSPTLKAQSIQVGFVQGCNGCMRLNLNLIGGVEAGLFGALELGGRIGLRTRIAGAELDGEPAIRVSVEGIDELRLELPVRLPGPFQQVQRGLEDGLRTQVSDTLKANPELASQVIPLGERFQMGDGVSLEGLGISTEEGQGSELFLGLNTNLKARSAIRFEARSGSLQGSDWALVIDEEVVSALMLQAIQGDQLPTRFTAGGQVDPQGPVACDLQTVRFTPKGFEVDARLWYFKFPAWWRDYTIVGSVSLEGGLVNPHIVDMVPGQGGGATWVTGIVERKLTSESTMKAMGKKMPRQMEMPMGEGKLAILTPRWVGTEAGTLIVRGDLEVVDAPAGGATDEKKAPGAHPRGTSGSRSRP